MILYGRYSYKRIAISNELDLGDLNKVTYLEVIDPRLTSVFVYLFQIICNNQMCLFQKYYVNNKYAY